MQIICCRYFKFQLRLSSTKRQFLEAPLSSFLQIFFEHKLLIDLDSQAAVNSVFCVHLRSFPCPGLPFDPAQGEPGAVSARSLSVVAGRIRMPSSDCLFSGMRVSLPSLPYCPQDIPSSIRGAFRPIGTPFALQGRHRQPGHAR